MYLQMPQLQRYMAKLSNVESLGTQSIFCSAKEGFGIDNENKVSQKKCFVTITLKLPFWSVL